MTQKITGSTPSLSDLAKSYVRTVIPVIVGFVISIALRAGVDLHGYVPEITSAVTFLYYALARALEHYVDPRFGWLLGLASRPLYAEGVVKAQKGHRDTGAISGPVIPVVILVVLIVILLGVAVNHWIFFALLAVLLLIVV